MSRSFSASSTYLSKDAAVITDYPFSMGCWFKAADITSDFPLMWIGDKDSGNHFCYLAARGDIGGNPVRAFTHFYEVTPEGAAARACDSSSGYSADTWHHALGVFTNNLSRTCYLDGGSSNETTSQAADISQHDRTAIGAHRDSSPTYNSAEVLIAEAAYWSASLNASEAAALGAGISPRQIRPQSLVAYYPLWGTHSPEIDLTSGGNSLTVTGATKANHAPVVPYSRKWWPGSSLASVSSVSIALTGTVTASIDESDIVTGAKDVILTITGDTWVAL